MCVSSTNMKVGELQLCLVVTDIVTYALFTGKYPKLVHITNNKPTIGWLNPIHCHWHTDMISHLSTECLDRQARLRLVRHITQIITTHRLHPQFYPSVHPSPIQSTGQVPWYRPRAITGLWDHSNEYWQWLCVRVLMRHTANYWT